ncbi:Stp1/IreP family PP2C-type Ser/Thr phosphatase [Sporanaerobacter acetigenes]|uniref:protein-serine/threonine phosphatase n=1 Tax=Sporanaerobacter acetigenes DSM 13106 TaxID=1123281 RepID=A0A1M5XXQ0_9FIRM|nr:Stp1/IreP family PP2C-type Ser/Thr phosphatase [Sporanaerobacter acetigenes]SHI04328.1 protein phosphatase [Sporanaerobacter acetigenes DSM 13106]
MQIGVCSDIGKARENNQDSYFYSQRMDFPLFIVADGMGGHKAGEVASCMAVEIVKDFFLDKKKQNLLDNEENLISFIEESINRANDKIYKKAISNEQYNGMGTTLTMAYFLNGKVFIGHVGDSRAYLVRDNGLMQLTDDHSLVAELVKKGSISKEEAQYHPQRNIITRAVGTSEEIDVDIKFVEIKNDDILLMCTDGLTSMIEENEIKNLLLVGSNMQESCNDLIKKANDLGGLDNITVIAMKIV